MDAPVLQRLFNAIKKKDEDAVRSIIQYQPHIVNAKWKATFGWGMITPLMEASHVGSVDIVKVLLDRGANTAATGYVLEGCSVSNLNEPRPMNDGRSHAGFGIFDDLFPLYIAAKKMQKQVIEELLRAGADIHQTNFMGQTYLHSVCMNYNDANAINTSVPISALSTVKLLISNGADVNLKDKNGRTPLHHGCGSFSEDIVIGLLEGGADVSAEDNFGITPLQIAALCSYQLTETILKTASLLSHEKIIEAYEIAGLAISNSPNSGYLAMQKATTMRDIHNVQKVILEPTECYDNVKEWETLEELEEYENNHGGIYLQALIARERIFHGKFFDLMADSTREGIARSGINAVGEMQRHYLSLVERNNDYFYIGDSFVMYNTILLRLCYPTFVIENAIIEETMNVVFKSFDKLQEALDTSTQTAKIWQLIAKFRQTLLLPKYFIMQLLGRADDASNNVSTAKADLSLAADILRTLQKRVAYLRCPFINYKSPVAHLMFDHRTLCLWPVRFNEFDHKLLDMLIELGLDLDLTDSYGHSLLHVAVSSSPDKRVVQILLENGIHSHARNEMRQTALDIMRDPRYKYNAKEVVEMLVWHDRLHSLKCLSAMTLRDMNISGSDESLPKSLLKFIKLH